jgi:hypothetical protein
MRDRQRLTWPSGLERTSTREAWFERFRRLPGGLDLAQVSERLNEPYGAARRWAALFGYQFPDRRRRGVPAETWDRVDWDLRDADIAREVGVTRECVRLIRRQRGAGPSAAQAAIDRLTRFVVSYRDRLHGLLVEEVIHHSGTDLPYHVVRRILRDHGVRAHEPESRLNHVDWRLPNHELAEIWDASARYVANLRARLQVGPARWGTRESRTEPSYAQAVVRERKKAQTHRRRIHPRRPEYVTAPVT